MGSIRFALSLIGFSVLVVPGRSGLIDPTVPIPAEDVRMTSGARIISGIPAVLEQIPHQISLRMVNSLGGVSSCGGSVIHTSWVVTAAHCVANRYSYIVRIGMVNITLPGMMIESNTRFIHPGYYEPTAGVQTDDIALVPLNLRVSYSNLIKPIRMMNSAQKNINFNGVRLTGSGYGRTTNTGSSSEILMWTYLSGISNEECLSWYPRSSVIQEETICSRYYNVSTQSSCSGDSGGPLTFIDYDGRPTMVGVLSFGSTAGCDSPFPSGWVRPGHYHKWFQDITGINFDWLPIH